MKPWSLLLWIFPVLLMKITHGAESTTSCPEYCICHGTQNVTVVCCSGDFPTPFIVPDLPDNTVTADLSQCYLQDYPQAVVSKLLRLQHLSIGNLQAPRLYLNSPDVKLPNLRILNISMGNLQDVLIDIPTILPRLEKLYLHGNKLYDIPQLSCVRCHGQLRYLDLRDNRLTMLSARDCTTLDKFKEAFPAAEIDLRNNPFDCRCSRDTFEFVHWIQANAASLTRAYEVTCLVPPPYKDFRRVHEIIDLQLGNYAWYNLKCKFNDTSVTCYTAIFAIFVVIYAQHFREWKYTPNYIINVFYTLCGYCCFKLKNNSTCSVHLEPTIVMKLPLPSGLSGYVNIDRCDERPRVYVIFDERDRQVTNFVKTRLNKLIGPDFYAFTNASLGPGAPVAASVDVAVSISACSLVVISSGLLKNTAAMSGVLSALSTSPLHPLFVIYGPAFTADVLKGFVEWLSKDADVVMRLLTLGRYVEWLEDDNRWNVLARAKVSNHLLSHSNVEEVDEALYFAHKENLHLTNLDNPLLNFKPAGSHPRDVESVSENIQLSECTSNLQELVGGSSIPHKQQRMKEELFQCFQPRLENPKACCVTMKDVEMARRGVDGTTPSETLEIVTTRL